MKSKTIFIITILLLFVVVIIQNTEVVGFNILFWSIEMSRAILFPIIFIAGLILGLLGGFIISKKKQ